MTNSNYCTMCNETLTLHADGSIACSCDFLDCGSDQIPETWQLTGQELVAARSYEIADA
jgi:hypothetical protein